MPLKVISVIPVLALILLASPAQALSLSLTCQGTGSVSETTNNVVTRFDRRTKKTTTANEVSTRHRDTQGRVLVEITDQGGRINLPTAVLPGMHSGSDAGWRPLQQLAVGEEKISGHFPLNFLSNPSVIIDRRSGVVEIEGIDGFTFSGDCRPKDVGAGERQF